MLKGTSKSGTRTEQWEPCFPMKFQKYLEAWDCLTEPSSTNSTDLLDRLLEDFWPEASPLNWREKPTITLERDFRAASLSSTQAAMPISWLKTILSLVTWLSTGLHQDKLISMARQGKGSVYEIPVWKQSLKVSETTVVSI